MAKARQYFGSSTTSRSSDSNRNTRILNTSARFLKSVCRPDEDTQIQMVLGREGQITDLARLIDAETQHDTQADVTKGQMLLKSFEAPINRLNQQVEVIYTKVEEGEYTDMLRWVSTIPYSRHHERISENRVHGTGEWLLRHPKYLQWKSSSSSSIMLLQGIMGSGKTSLSSRVIDSFLSEQQVQSASLAYFYCANSSFEPARADLNYVLRSLVRQMTFVGDIARRVRETLTIEYQRRKAEAKLDGFEVPQLRINDCVKIILDVLSSSTAVIVIDAVDEVQKTQRHELIQNLTRIVAQASSVVKIFITSRSSHDLAQQIDDHSTITVNRFDSRCDMELVVGDRIDAAIESKRLLGGKVSESLQVYLKDRLANVASDVYFTVFLLR